MQRRVFLKVLGGAVATGFTASPVMQALAADGGDPEGHFFIFIHASGGWDVTLWADPRNERKGIVEPASTENTDPAALTHWKPTKLEGDIETFEILTAGNLRFGPGIGDLFDLHDRLTIVNGL